MSPKALYAVLDNAGATYDVIEIFEGMRVIAVLVTEPTDEDNHDEGNDNA